MRHQFDNHSIALFGVSLHDRTTEHDGQAGHLVIHGMTPMPRGFRNVPRLKSWAYQLVMRLCESNVSMLLKSATEHRVPVNSLIHEYDQSKFIGEKQCVGFSAELFRCR